MNRSSDHREDSPRTCTNHRWEALEDLETVCEWTVDPGQGLVQGPLETAFFAGQRLALVLAEDQVALVEADGRLRGLLLAGTHVLDVGEGAGQLPPLSRLHFLHTGPGLELRWPEPVGLWIEGPDALRRPLAMTGRMDLAICDPAAFHAAFLAGVLHPDPASLPGLVDALIRSRLEARLGGAGESPSGPQAGTDAARRALGELRPEDLDAELAEYGLCCHEFAIETLQTESVDAAVDPARAARPCRTCGGRPDGAAAGQTPVPCDNGA